MIKAVFFDFFGVISSDDYWNFIGEAKQESGKFHKLADEVNLGQLGWQEFVTELSKISDKSVDEINDMYSKHTINRELVQIARALKENYQVGMITNAHEDYLKPILVETHLDEVFNPIVMSSNLGVVKPNKEIFIEAARQSGVELNEMLFIDDIQTNVDGASSAGVNAFLYESPTQVLKELEMRGITNA